MPPGGEDPGGTVARSVAALAAQVELLARQVAELAELTVKPAAKGSGAFTWLDAAGAHRDLDKVLTEVARWLGVVYLQFPDAAESLPDCWLWHPPVVEELLWLCDAWRNAYKPGAPAHLVGDWHDRLRPGVVRRIHKYAGTCSPAKHAANGELHKPAPTVPGADAIAAISLWWATDRDSPGPVPERRDR